MNAPQTNTTLTTTGSGRSIGEILVATGRLSAPNLQRVLERQKLDSTPFGTAAVALNLLTKDDIDFALSKQFDYAYLTPQDASVSPELVAAFKPFSRVGENLRAVRSQLMLRWFNGQALHQVLAIVSPQQGEGRSFIAANLAIVFAQNGERTLLIDGNMRATTDTGQHALFKLGRGVGLSGVLSGRGGLEAAQLVPGLPGLAVLPAGSVPPNPQELIGRNSFADLLREACQQFDVILIDTPAGEDSADAELIAARAGAALMVARKDYSLTPKTSAMARRMQDSGIALVGAVLNDA